MTVQTSPIEDISIPPTDVDDDIGAHSKAVLADKSRSFRFASLLLPKSHRDDVAVLYAVCRTVDDIADESDDPDRANQQLSRFADELRGGATPRPLVASFLSMAHRRRLDIDSMLELIRGVRSDLGGVRIETDAELIRYCYRVAGTVGLMMCPLLGVDDDNALSHAVDLGIGMQLTNICRDVVEDAHRDRVYLPARRLRHRDLTPDQIAEMRFDPSRLAPVVRDLLDLADEYYESADAGMHYIPASSRLAIVVASRFYRAIGVRLLRRNADVTARRSPPSIPEFLRHFAQALVAWTELSSTLTEPTSHDPSLHRPLRDLPGIASP